jgi:hypothetical protein
MRLANIAFRQGHGRGAIRASPSLHMFERMWSGSAAKAFVLARQHLWRPRNLDVQTIGLVYARSKCWFACMSSLGWLWDGPDRVSWARQATRQLPRKPATPPVSKHFISEGRDPLELESSATRAWLSRSAALPGINGPSDSCHDVLARGPSVMGASWRPCRACRPGHGGGAMTSPRRSGIHRFRARTRAWLAARPRKKAPGELQLGRNYDSA